MSFSPVTIEPQYVRMTGFTYDIGSIGYIPYIVRFGKTVSEQARQAVADAFDKVHGTTPGWNYAAAGNVAAFGGDMLQEATISEDPFIVFVVTGKAGDNNPVKLVFDATVTSPPLVDRMVVRMSGDLFENNDSLVQEKQFFWALHMVGRALGITVASKEQDVMFPVFADNLSISECDIDALNDIFPGPPADPAVTCGAVMPAAQPLPSTLSVSSLRSFYVAGETAIILVDGDVSGLLHRLYIVSASDTSLTFVATSDGSGNTSFSLPTGGLLGVGTYTIYATAERSGFSIRSTNATFDVLAL
jgi:hypothetical protein